ncbi:putative Ig domain-containing protein [Sporosarcina sp. FSL K6-3457]|uniref:putative Ig domain-containing protein n=1 Tax=Sporosarcina sp. FSL K6-3457 TaxID=2978204 RepID=UPI0030F52C65
MNRKHLKYGWAFFMAMFLVVLSGLTVHAAAGPTLEVGETRSLGDKVRVPITIYKTTYLTSVNATVTVPADQKGVRLQSFEPAGIFAGTQYRSLFDITGNVLKFDFLFEGVKEPTLVNKPTVVGYITYTLTPEFEAGQTVQLEIGDIRAKARAGADLLLDPLHGKIERKLPIGGVISDNGPSAAAAMRILQHVDGTNLITEKEMLLSADVDGNGKLTQDDAQLILDYLAGITTSFLAIETVELDNAAVGSEYEEKITAKHGREPYEFKSKGSLPSGVKLNTQTGELTGVAKTAKNYPFTIIVTDAIGNTAERAFAVDVINSNIIAVEKLGMINVRQGEQAKLPERVLVTYKDKVQGYESVTWDAVDTTGLGEQTVKGVIGDSGFTITIKVNVVNENYINKLIINKSPFLDLHTVVAYTVPEVYAMTINGTDMHYEGNNEYSSIVTGIPSGSNITLVLKDKYGNVLETKSQNLLPS